MFPTRPSPGRAPAPRPSEDDAAVMFAREMAAYRPAHRTGDVKVLSYACVQRGGSVACGRRPALLTGRAPAGGGCYGRTARRDPSPSLQRHRARGGRCRAGAGVGIVLEEPGHDVDGFGGAEVDPDL